MAARANGRSSGSYTSGAVISLILAFAAGSSCDDGQETAAAAGGGVVPPPPCAPQHAYCNEVDSPCVALEDNSLRDRFLLRLSQAHIIKPEVLVTLAPIVEPSIIINAPQCNLDGDGTFNWLFEFDIGNGSFRIGASRPAAEPKDGYCLLMESLAQDWNFPDLEVIPAQVGLQLEGDQFVTTEPANIVVPLYNSVEATGSIGVPFRQLIVEGTLSQDHNCIGAYNAEGLDPANDCLPEDDRPLFVSGGRLEGFISLEDADNAVYFEQTLCVIFTGESSGMFPIRCPRDVNGVILAEGDWCSTTNAPATSTCHDALRFEAEIAASAVPAGAGCGS
jgi:hypothetical protein